MSSGAFWQVLGEEADTLRHTLAEIGVRIGRDQVFCSGDFFCAFVMCVCFFKINFGVLGLCAFMGFFFKDSVLRVFVFLCFLLCLVFLCFFCDFALSCACVFFFGRRV